MELTELAWAAGLFDGEGHIGTTSTNSPHLDVGQTDRRVLDRFRDAVGFGRVLGPAQKRSHEKPVWHYRLYKQMDVQAVVAMLWKYLSPVKRQQAHRVLLRNKQKLQAQGIKGVCKRLHVGAPRRANGDCVECNRVRSQTWRDQRVAFEKGAS